MTTDYISSQHLLQCNIGLVLAPCLQELVEVRPQDPIFFIAQWLYTYADNRVYYDHKAAFLAEVMDTADELEGAKRLKREKRAKMETEVKKLKAQLPPEEIESEPDIFAKQYDILQQYYQYQRGLEKVNSRTAAQGQSDFHLDGLLTDFASLQKRRAQISSSNNLRQSQSLGKSKSDFAKKKGKRTTSRFRYSSSSFTSYTSTPSSSSSESHTANRPKSDERRDSRKGGGRKGRRSTATSASGRSSRRGTNLDFKPLRRRSKLGFNEIDDFRASKTYGRHPRHYDRDDGSGRRHHAHERDDHIDADGKHHRGHHHAEYVSESGTTIKRVRDGKKDGFMDKDGIFRQRQKMDGREGYLDESGTFREMRRVHGHHHRDVDADGKTRQRDRYRSESGTSLKKIRTGSKEGFSDKHGRFYPTQVVDGREGYLDGKGVFRELRSLNDQEKTREQDESIDSNGDIVKRLRSGDEDGFVGKDGHFYPKKKKGNREGYIDNNGTFHDIQRTSSQEESIDKEKTRHEVYVDKRGNFLKPYRAGDRDGYMDANGKFREKHVVGDREGYLDENGIFHEMHCLYKRDTATTVTTSGRSDDDDETEIEDDDGEVKATSSSIRLKRKGSKTKRRGQRRERDMCVWFARGSPMVLMCYHPVLGVLMAPHRARVAVQRADDFWGTSEYSCQVVYDQEIYTVCDPSSDDYIYKKRQREWTGETWLGTNMSDDEEGKEEDEP